MGRDDRLRVRVHAREDDFARGRYLAGIEARKDAEAPVGWEKWCVPGFEYIKVRASSPNTFKETLDMMAREGIPLVGAVQDYTDPATGESFMLFPVGTQDSE